MQGVRNSGSPRVEVGEIDTRAPFQSVKAAVSLFGEVAFNRDRFSIKRRSSENVFEKETQLILAQKELSKLKKQLDSAEATKARALSDLEKARMALQNLTAKLSNMRESKQSAIEAAEAVKNQGQKLEKALSLKAIGFDAWKQEIEHARREYTATVTELDASKQDLTKIRQDFDTALEAKLAALQAAGEAHGSAKLNSERVSELSKEIANMKVRASIEQMKLASGEQENAMGQREAQLGFYKSAKEAALEKLDSLKSEYDPELIKSLDAKLAETSAEIEALHEQMKKVHASKMDSVRLVTQELKGATKKLQDIAEEESSLKHLVYSLRIELKQVKKEQGELKEMEQAAETLASNLADLQRSMGEAMPQPGSAEEKEAEMYYEQSLKIRKLSSEGEDAKREAEEMRRKAQELKQEPEKSWAAAEEAEKKLQLALKEAKEAKSAEQRAIEAMEHLADVQRRVTNSKTGAKIKLPKEEYESLTGKVKKCEDLVEKKEAAVMAEVQEICVRKNEVDRKVEESLKAIHEIKVATEVALWHAEMADSAKEAVESEIMRWHQIKQKGAADSSAKTSNCSENSPRSISLSM